MSYFSIPINFLEMSILKETDGLGLDQDCDSTF